jgi:hypothetical protein
MLDVLNIRLSAHNGTGDTPVVFSHFIDWSAQKDCEHGGPTSIYTPSQETAGGQRAFQSVKPEHTSAR